MICIVQNVQLNWLRKGIFQLKFSQWNHFNWMMTNKKYKLKYKSYFIILKWFNHHNRIFCKILILKEKIFKIFKLLNKKKSRHILINCKKKYNK